MSRIFVDRPIFAWVLAIIVMMAGVGALFTLPIEQYPDVAPTNVNVRASYPGASAQTVEDSVTQVLEQQLAGIDGMLYFTSQSTSRGNVNIAVTFAKGIDPDIAQVQVQNQIQSAIPRLPQPVQNQGVRVTKSNPDQLLTIAVYDRTNTRSNQDVADYLASNIQDPLSRVDGVGDVNVMGSPHAMRIWLNPHRLTAYSLMPSDIIAAISAQNTEIAAGEVGGLPAPAGQMLNATITALSRFQTPEQFRAIVLKTLPSGAHVTLGDVARVEIGAESYAVTARMNGFPAAGISVSMAPGADALKTAELVKTKVAELERLMPDGLAVAYGNDTTDFIKLSVEDVQKSLMEAIVLVVIVMFVFLQSWRATLIPAIAVPVVLLGTFAIFSIAGFSINTMTLFGMVLAIGLLVDDAIIVVENVQRLMEENPGMSPREATLKSMDEIQMALIAIAMVLSAVFLPMAFFGGSTGVIYKQFSITIIASMTLSVLVALILSPALTAHLLKPIEHDGSKDDGWIMRRFPRAWAMTLRARDGFNNRFTAMTERYASSVERVVERKWLFLIIYAAAVALLAVMFLRLPTGFIPNEDQGSLSLQYRLPAGATQQRTIEVGNEIQQYFQTNMAGKYNTLMTVSGGAGGGSGGQNTGVGFIKLSPWDERKGAENAADAIAKQASGAFRSLRDAQVFVLVPGAIRGLGQSSGFTMELLNRGGLSRDEFVDARDRLLAAANANDRLASVRLTDLPDISTLKVDIDPVRLTALGLTQASVNSTLSTAMGGNYVNDFIDKGRVKRVFVQGDTPYRSSPEAIGEWFVRNNNGAMAPFSAFSRTSWSTAPASSSRFNGVAAFEFSGDSAAGVSSGQAMNEMERMARAIPGVDVAWAGASYQERLSSSQAPLLYGLSLVVVFLCLAALYESWSIPVAVLLVIPLGLIGAVLAVTFRGLENDVYLQIGLLTTMGLAAKNAILMIEFAELAEKRGMRIIDAAIEAARLRLRPILMTSFAFIFGVLPLAIATGAGANSRIAIGTAVIGGMLTATLLAVFYIPLFFVLVRRGVRDGVKAVRERIARRSATQEAEA